jgi:cytoskeletal protein CcmA (bactofilin family)
MIALTKSLEGNTILSLYITNVASDARKCARVRTHCSEQNLRVRQLSTTGLEADMDRPAEIGASIVIKGDITAQEELVISGRVEGSITIADHLVTVKPGAELVADIDAHTILIGGQVIGVLSASDSIELQPSANVEGELMASALRITDGAVFNGKAHTTGTKKDAKLQLAS